MVGYALFALSLLIVVELCKEAAVPDFPHDDAEGVDICFLRHDVGVQHFWRKILHCAVLDAGHLPIMRSHLHRQPKVTQLRYEATGVLRAAPSLSQHDASRAECRAASHDSTSAVASGFQEGLRAFEV